MNSVGILLVVTEYITVHVYIHISFQYLEVQFQF